MQEKYSAYVKWGAVAAAAALIPLLPALRRRAMRVTAILKKDHRVASVALAGLQKMPRSAARGPVFERLCNTLMIHEQVEDEVVYTAIHGALLRRSGSELDDAYGEQETVKDLLKKMTGLDPASDEFESRLGELKQTIEEHAELEERSVFRYIENHVSPAEQSNMGERLHALKRDMKEMIAA